MKEMKKKPLVTALLAMTTITFAGGNQQTVTQKMLDGANWTPNHGKDPATGKEVRSIHHTEIGDKFGLTDADGNTIFTSPEELRVAIMGPLGKALGITATFTGKTGGS